MKSIREFDNTVWNRFFDFVFVDETELTRKQIQDDLRCSRVDLRQPLAKLRQVLRRASESQDAKEVLETARRARPHIHNKVICIQAPEGPTIREKLKRMIVDLFAEPQRSVHARRLESASSDEDLRSLLEDISRLEAFSEESEDDDKP